MKRAVDVVVALIVGVLLLPVGAAIAAVVRVKMGRPVIFWQERAGRGGVPFRMPKFRTMSDARDPDGHPLSDDERLTRVGRMLRATSLDELPQLWSVLTGHMSLVGPRPLPTTYVARYSDDQRRRLEVRPGLTGWAQINGRNSISWADRFRLDCWYVDNRSAWLDLRILVRTVALVFRRVGISAEGHSTMPEFGGSSEG